MTIDEIHQAFSNTTFKVLSIPNIDIKINTTIKELNHLSSWAFITAWNPNPEVLSLEENNNRNQKLMDDINNLGLKSIPGIGVSEDEQWSEDSFLIECISLEIANQLAAKYNQLAFVFGKVNEVASLIYTVKQ